ncbi:hypothetical protein PLEOSDRAFT_1098528 [Pleurotus ostreatus PC15]|uniref:Uncharacterized protein n=1 Tax=Pleurotus ostreatus (strain PC15) TaxID=1137138 RepID=A0A067NWS9_PLEO1|nr:hypothetical protein PLEOSDRAFT_1098528 [Pleurotus ostreatus PC15]
MFATVNPTTLPTPGIGGHGYSAKSFAMQIPKGFRIFKHPTMTSFPYASATAKFDVGYRPSTFSMGGDARPNPAWSSQRQDVDARMFSTGFYNHIQPSIATASLSSNMRTYDTRSGNTLPYYPIYQDPTKDTYIYERSDTYSLSEIDTPPAASSAFSPALSTDSTTSVKSSELPDRSLSRSSQRAVGPSGGSGSSNPSAIQRQPSSSATSTSNALSIVRVASSRGSSQPESTIISSHSSASSANERPRTPNYLSQPAMRPTGQPLGNQYTNGFQVAPQMARVQSNSWKDYVEESILDQSSETARLNATLNARASARASMLYAQDELPEDHTDYQSIPQVPLPPDDVGQYAPVMSSSPDSYFPHAADMGSRRTSPVSPNQPRQQPRRTSPQQTHVSPTGSLVPYQPSADRLSQEDEPFIPPLSYDNAASYITADPGLRASAASLPGGAQYSRNPAPSTSSVSSGSSSGSGRMSSFPAQPPMPVGQTGSNVFPQNDQQRYSQNLASGYNNVQQSTFRPEQERPLPVPPTVAPIPERGFAFPQSASSSHRSRSRTPSVSPPPVVPPEGGRVRKDSIAVETVRLMKKKERPPSTSPPLDEQSRRRPGPGSNPAMPLSTNLSQAAASAAAGVVSQQPLVRSPTNPPPTWPSNGISFQVTGIPPPTTQPTGDASARQMANTLVPTGTQASRRPLPGPRRMNSDPVPPSAPRIPPPPRRNTGGEQLLQPDADKCVLARLRVRWNETLICPSPIKPGDRRKGWFNRRGDQLWTNDGSYKPASPGEEYPVDLDSYPEYGIGWMNESGIRIDMEHRLIPKAPLRSALKQTQPQV